MSTYTTEPHAKGEFGEPPALKPRPGLGRYARKVLKPVASLQVTVVLFTLGMLLIFFGTVAQIDFGIWTVVEKYFASWVVWVPFDLIHKFLGVFWKEQFPPDTSPWTGSFPFPAGFAIGAAMVLNLLAAHAIRFRLGWKRTGIFLIHGGLVLLFVGEFITRNYAIEQQMTITEGGYTDYAIDTRNVELALIDGSDSKEDKVTVISQSRLRAARPGERITHPDLPVDVEVVKYMKNSDFKEPGAGVTNPATEGTGLKIVAVEAPEESGVETKQRGDIASAYVKLYKKGTDEVLGVHLVSLIVSMQGMSDTVNVGDTPYELSLRQARYYKPYRVYLDKFRFDRYPGTNKPKNYSSDVRVYELPQKPGDEPIRVAHIAMNEPMRYAGETFYQQSFDKTETTTVLQVVKNPGWLDFWFFQASIDYIACALVGFGLVLHFSIFLVQFLMRQSKRPAASATATPVALAPPVGGGVASRIFPWLMLAVAAALLMSVYGRMNADVKKSEYDLDSFSRIPVIEGGRVKPLETVARVNLRMVSHREHFVDEGDNRQPATQWYLDVLAARSPDDGSAAWKHKVFRVENNDVRNELKLPHREGLRYSFDEIRPQLFVLLDRAAKAHEKMDAKKPLDVAEAKFIELEERIATVLNLCPAIAMKDNPAKNTLRVVPPTDGGGWVSLKTVYEDARGEAELVGVKRAHDAIQANPNFFNGLTDDQQRKLVRTVMRFDLDQLEPSQRVEALVESAKVLKLPLSDIPAKGRSAWLQAAYSVLPSNDAANIKAEVERDFQGRVQSASAGAAGWQRMIAAYRDGKPGEFNEAVKEYRETQLEPIATKDLVRTRVEVSYNRFGPFYWLTSLYVFALLLAVVGFALHAAEAPRWASSLRLSALLIITLTLIVHALSLVARMYIMDRWGVFVTNLYSSAVFIGFGCVALCWLLELIFPIGIGNVVASTLGLATCIVAHNLGTQDTLEMMEAVLDTNFWLATHVTTVTLGYTATFVAGFLGAIYVYMMLGTVVRDSFRNTAEPTVGSLLSFGVAAMGVVGIPLLFMWFMTTALDKYEVMNHDLLWTGFFVLLALGAIYAVTLMLLRVGAESVDAQGRPVAAQIPNVAKPVAALGLTPESSKILGQMVYGVVCFATLLSFIGTVLGGIWADQSWGRFWGWDPKENGAVLIVLWNSLILHARWSGLVKDRGVAVLAIFGNVVTAWSWFGTNQLGIGLHAYGFDSRLADGCFNFWVSQLFILGLGLIPARFWPSARLGAPAAKPVAGVPPLPSGANTNTSADAAPDGGPASAGGNGNGQPRREKGKRSGKRR